jgi:hypothetical protein
VEQFKTSVKKCDKTSTVLVPKKWNLSLIQTIHFGTKQVSCHVETHDDDFIAIPEQVWNELSLPYNQHITVYFHDQSLFIGPLIGVFTAGFTGSLLRPIGTRSIFFAKLLSMSKSIGAFTFLFGAHLIDWETGMIEGYMYDSDTGWKRVEVPFPNVIYDRLPNRKTEDLETIQSIKKRLKQDYGIPWFNNGFFNKWETHKLLRNIKEVSFYLPETYFQPTKSDIVKVLKKYHHVYLKPANGSLGLGIYQIIYSEEENMYYCRFRSGEKNRLRKFKSLDTLLDLQFKNRDLNDYIVQQGVSLLREDHKPFDFRIHVNKDGSGQWQYCAVAAKIAGSGSVTTHVKNGGFIKAIEEVITEQSMRKRIEEKLEQAALLLSHYIEKQSDGTIGEIGFDIGVDKEENIWLFEANSKPGRSIFYHPKLNEQDLMTRKYPLLFAMHLTEKSIRNPEAVLQL